MRTRATLATLSPGSRCTTRSLTVLHLHRPLRCIAQGREEILRVHITQKGLPLGEDVRVDQLAAQVQAHAWLGQPACPLPHVAYWEAGRAASPAGRPATQPHNM